jgi:hypothetical protein
MVTKQFTVPDSFLRPPVFPNLVAGLPSAPVFPNPAASLPQSGRWSSNRSSPSLLPCLGHRRGPNSAAVAAPNHLGCIRSHLCCHFDRINRHRCFSPSLSPSTSIPPPRSPAAAAAGSHPDCCRRARIGLRRVSFPNSGVSSPSRGFIKHGCICCQRKPVHEHLPHLRTPSGASSP